MSADQIVVLLVRCGLVLLFLPFSALDKIFNFSGAVGQASETFSARPLAIAAIVAGLGIEIVMSLGIVLGSGFEGAPDLMARIGARHRLLGAAPDAVAALKDPFGVAAAPIPGTRRAARVEENLGSLDVALDDDQLARLDAAAAAVSGHRFADLTWISAGRE